MFFSKKLKKFKNIKHCFFSRKNGFSKGNYRSLNCGLGSNDKKETVLKNLAYVSKKIGCKNNSLITLKLYNAIEDTEYNVSTDISGSCSDSNIEELSVLGKAVVGEEDIILTSFKLQQNYPNPFNPTTTINFNVQVDGIVTLKIYDITGRLVKTLVNNEFKSSGNANGYDVMWDGTDNFGVGVSAGLYLYNLQSADMNVTKKMIYMK